MIRYAILALIILVAFAGYSRAAYTLPAIPAECIEEFGDMSGWNIIVGTEGADVIIGTNASDLIFALGGADEVYAGDPAVQRNTLDHDCIVGGKGNDVLEGGHGNDVILGGQGNDFLFGNYGSDYLYGQGQFDVAIGGTDSSYLDWDECWANALGPPREYTNPLPGGKIYDCEEWVFE